MSNKKHLPYFDNDKKELQSPHIVILGAGASKAAFPNGDKEGKKIPLMNDLIKILGLKKIIRHYNLFEESGDFEKLYSTIYENKRYLELKNQIDNAIIEYFSSFSITNNATIYDYLVLSLKEKDIIASFNWDPFLLQAYRRNIGVCGLPKIVFLHGNVYMGYCPNDRNIGYNGDKCNKCGSELVPSRLLFPVTQKNYNDDPVIKFQWDVLSQNLENGYFLTIFGYSAPKTDIEAIDLMKTAWGNNGAMEFAQIEIIDIKSREEITNSWKEFTVREHYGITNRIENTWLWKFPKETGEALFDATLQNSPIKENPFPKTDNLTELQDFAKNIIIRPLEL